MNAILVFSLFSSLLAVTPTLIEEARGLFYSAKYETSVEAEKKERYNKGFKLAEEYRALSPKDPAGILWWVANKGALVELEKGVGSLGTIGELEKALKELEGIDRSYGYNASDRILGVLYWKAPGWISIGSHKKARIHLKQAVDSAPQYPGNWSKYGQFLLDRDEKKEARECALKMQELLGKKDATWGQFDPEKKDWLEVIQKLLSATQENHAK
jgi:tetratricopeptide (TPR) repeat protein